MAREYNQHESQPLLHLRLLCSATTLADHLGLTDSAFTPVSVWPLSILLGTEKCLWAKA